MCLTSLKTSGHTMMVLVPQESEYWDRRGSQRAKYSNHFSEIMKIGDHSHLEVGI